MASASLHRLVGAARSLVAHGLYYSGALGLWCRVALRRRAVVLTYHRVLAGDALARTWSHPGIVVSRDTFDAHVRTLSRLFRVLSIDEFVEALEHGGFREPSCLITFDDGWRDTFTEAWPVLQRYDAPAVVFLPVDYIGATRMFWQEELSALLHRAWERRADATLRAACEGVCAAHGLTSPLDAAASDVRFLISTRVNALKSRPIAVPRGLIADLRAALGDAAVDDLLPVDGFMTWDEVRRMRAGRTAFGGHGTTHRLLTTLSADEVAEEASRSRATIARELDEAPVSFSYPNGDWNPGVAGAVAAAGYRVSFSTERGAVTPDDPRLSLRRVNMHEATATPPMLLARLVGLI
jgi:peptidoglycan/xylan/chitin deacetylase (PgdA/CDA1 family)